MNEAVDRFLEHGGILSWVTAMAAVGGLGFGAIALIVRNAVTRWVAYGNLLLLVAIGLVSCGRRFWIHFDDAIWYRTNDTKQALVWAASDTATLFAGTIMLTTIAAIPLVIERALGPKPEA